MQWYLICSPNQQIALYIIIFSLLLLVILWGLVVNDVINKIKEEYKWSWTAESKGEYISTEFIGLTSIGLLYFVVQMGIIAIFFPGFDQIQIAPGRHLYP